MRRLLFALVLLWAVPAFAADEPAAPEIPAFESAARDPFNFDGAVAEKKVSRPSTPGFSLEGFIWQSDEPQALINGQIVGIGGRVGEAEVLEIDEKGVKMRGEDGKEIQLKPKGK